MLGIGAWRAPQKAVKDAARSPGQQPKVRISQPALSKAGVLNEKASVSRSVPVHRKILADGELIADLFEAICDRF